MSDLVAKVAAECHRVCLEQYDNYRFKTGDDPMSVHRAIAKAAIATVLREMAADDSAPFTAHYFISAFARQNGVALDRALAPSGEGEKDD